MKNQETAHLWMSGSKSAGSGSNMSFANGNLFSYNTMIAARRTNSQGDVIVFIDNTYYSRTTSSKHMPCVERASRNYLRVFYSVEECNADPKISKRPILPNDVKDDVINWYLRKEIDTLLLKASRARQNKELLTREVIEKAELLNNVLDWFGSKLERYDINKLKEEFSSQLEEIREKERQRQLRQEKRDRKEFAEWLEGTSNKVPSSFMKAAEAYLRVSPKNPAVVETSQGALFPLESCELLYKLWQRGTAISEEQAQRISIGHYRLTWLDPEKGIKAGCHFVPKTEIERFATVIGLRQES